MDALFLLFTGFIIGISGAIIPGPLTLFTVSQALKTDKFAGLKTITGHIIVEFAIIVLIFLGFRWVLTYEPFLFAVSIIGGLALIIMGCLLLANAPRMKLSELTTNEGFDRGLILGGMFFSLASPGFLAWWATIGISTLARASLLGVVGVAILVAGHWLADISWYGLLALAVDKGKTYVSDRTYRNIARFFALSLIVLGVAFLLA
jgi:threonine/homoserine/homoserine lactone efflux protein